MSGISKTAKIDFTATLSATGGRSRFRRENPPRGIVSPRARRAKLRERGISEPDILITDVTRVINERAISNSRNCPTGARRFNASNAEKTEWKVFFFFSFLHSNDRIHDLTKANIIRYAQAVSLISP